MVRESTWGMLFGNSCADVESSSRILIIRPEGIEVWVRNCDGLRGEVHDHARIARVGWTIGATDAERIAALVSYISGMQTG